MTQQNAYQWRLNTLQYATCGYWHNAGDVDICATRIVTDTKKIQAGDVFLTLKGERFDAHDFVQTAKDRGAVAAIVERALDCDLPQLIVKNTKLALGDLGRYRRNIHPDLTVIAITGSSGKTTTKEMMGAVLSQIAPTLITEGNLNNDLGVPMMLLKLTDAHRFAVLELGANHLGEIAYTAQMVRPDVAVVLNIGTAHMGEFGGREQIATAKAEIFSALSKSGVAVVPFADEFYEFLTTQAAKSTQKIISFGEQVADLDLVDLNDADKQILRQEGVSRVLVMGDVFADDIELSATHSEFLLNFTQDDSMVDSIPVRLPLIGEHNITNALSAAAAAFSVGISPKMIANGLTQTIPPKGRLTRLAFGRHILIDDTYNANPTSVIAAAKVLENEANTKILVLGDIFELGDTADIQHANLGEVLAKLDIDRVLMIGEHMQHACIAMNATRVIACHYQSKQALLTDLKDILDNHTTTVLFKGSRGMAMESLIADLTGNQPHQFIIRAC